MVRKTGSHLSRANAPLVVAQAGNVQSHLKPLADRTACGACETYGTWTVTLPVLQLTVRAGRYLPLTFQLRHVYAMPAAFAPVLRDVEELSTRFLPFALAR
jgi:hypothetical protein